MPPRSIETPSGFIALDEALGIVRIKNKKGVDQTVTDAKKNIAELLLLTNGVSYPVLVDLEGSVMSRDVRNYYGGREVRDKLVALALLVTNPVARVLANVFLAMKQSSTPTRLFATEGEAVEWLRAFTKSR